jgi:hypothetical protein
MRRTALRNIAQGGAVQWLENGQDVRSPARKT